MKIRNGILRTCCGILCAATVLMSPIKAEAAMSKEDKSAYMAVFDADYYYKTYPDVAKTFGKDKDALFRHFVNYGIAEGRNGNEEFNPQSYRKRYSDLQAAFGSNMAAYCSHYIRYGRDEGRDGSAGETEEGDYKQLGTYTTSYKTGVARATNVELAAQRVNGVVVQPGESFSFSNAILPRTSKNGYVVAPVFVNKKISKGLGGGVCQVSSTLYAAMLNAGLPATERHPHSLPVDYIPKGMDATISGTTLDLKFDNIYEQPLMIQASTEDGELTVSLVLVQ